MKLHYEKQLPKNTGFSGILKYRKSEKYRIPESGKYRKSEKYRIPESGKYRKSQKYRIPVSGKYRYRTTLLAPLVVCVVPWELC